MEFTNTKSFLGLALQLDHFSLVKMERGVIEGVASRELIQPFDLETFREEEGFSESQIEIVQDLYKRVGDRTKDVGVVLNSGMVLMRKIPLALGMEEKMVRDHIMWEAEQFLVTPLNDFVMEYQRLPFQNPAGNPIYLLILVRKEVISKIKSFLKSIGLILKEVDVDIFSYIRALVANYDLNFEKISVLVDIQREYLDFIFIRQQEYFLSHRVSSQEVESNLWGASEIAKLLLKELRRLIFGHRLGQGIEDLDRIFLLGDVIVQKVAQELSSTLSVPCDIVNPFRRINVSQTIVQSEEINKFPAKYVASVGGTLRRVLSPVE